MTTDGGLSLGAPRTVVYSILGFLLCFSAVFSCFNTCGYTAVETAEWRTAVISGGCLN